MKQHCFKHCTNIQLFINWILCTFSLNIVHSPRNNKLYQFITVNNILPVPVH